MSEITLPSRHRIWNSNPGGLRPSTLPLGSRSLPASFTSGWGRNFFFQTAETGIRTSNSSMKGNGANHYPRAPVILFNIKLQFLTQCSTSNALQNQTYRYISKNLLFFFWNLCLYTMTYQYLLITYLYWMSTKNLFGDIDIIIFAIILINIGWERKWMGF